MKFFRKAAPVAILATAALALGACAQSERDTGTPGATNGGGGASGGHPHLGAAGALKLFDPFYATDGETFRVTRQIFDGSSASSRAAPRSEPELVAEMPTPSEDGLKWTFKLRTGVSSTTAPTSTPTPSARTSSGCSTRRARRSSRTALLVRPRGRLQGQGADAPLPGLQRH